MLTLGGPSRHTGHQISSLGILGVALVLAVAVARPGPLAEALPSESANVVVPTPASPPGATRDPRRVTLREDLPDDASGLLKTVVFGDVVGEYPGHWTFVLGSGEVVDTSLDGSGVAVRTGGGRIVASVTDVTGSTVRVVDPLTVETEPVYVDARATLPLIAFPDATGRWLAVAGSGASGHAGVTLVSVPGNVATEAVAPRPVARGFLGEPHWTASGSVVAVPDCDQRTCTVDVVWTDTLEHVVVDELVPLAVTDTWLLGYRSTDDFSWEQLDLATGARTSIKALATVAPWSAYGLPSGRILVSGRSEADVLAVLVLDPVTGAVEPIYTAADDLRYLYPLVIDEDWAVLGPRAPLAGVIAGIDTLHMLELGTGRLYEDALSVD